MINLTPHKIVIRRRDGTDWAIEPSGTVARVEFIERVVSTVSGINVIKRLAVAVTGVPEEDSEAYLVSSMVLDALPGAKGVYAPDTGHTAIRNEKGHIVAVTRLVAA